MEKTPLTTIITLPALLAVLSVQDSCTQAFHAPVSKVDRATTVSNLIHPRTQDLEEHVTSVRMVVYGGAMGKGFDAPLNRTVDICMGTGDLNRVRTISGPEENWETWAKVLGIRKDAAC